jgi:hypothetical protein
MGLVGLDREQRDRARKKTTRRTQVIRFPQLPAARSAVLSGVLAGVLGASYLVASALAATDGATLPRAPAIVTHPDDPSAVRTAVFTFTDASWPVTFWCALDGDSARRCARDGKGRPGPRHRSTGGQAYSDLAYGPHCFYVFATNAARHKGRTTVFCWTIPPPPRRHHFPCPRRHHFPCPRRHHFPCPRRHHFPCPRRHHLTQNFSVGGDLLTPLYPGISEPDDLTFTNPNSFPITIASGGVSAANIAITSRQAGCGASNFAVIQGLTASVTVPARQLTPVSLSDLLVSEGSWPVIEMLDTNMNQDACEGATLTLTYAGIEATR